MTIKKRRVEIEEYYEKCPHCGKEISGQAESSVVYNMKVHVEMIHPEEYKKKQS